MFLGTKSTKQMWMEVLTLYVLENMYNKIIYNRIVFPIVRHKNITQKYLEIRELVSLVTTDSNYLVSEHYLMSSIVELGRLGVLRLSVTKWQ